VYKRQGRGGTAGAVALALAAWIRCWQHAASGDPRFGFSDPLSDQLSAAASRHSDSSDTVREFLSLDGVFQTGDAAQLAAPVARHLERITNATIAEASAYLD